MQFRKWQFWAVIGFFIFDLVLIGVPVVAVLILFTPFVRSLRLWLVDFLLELEEDKYATLNEQYGAEDQPKIR